VNCRTDLLLGLRIGKILAHQADGFVLERYKAIQHFVPGTQFKEEEQVFQGTPMKMIMQMPLSENHTVEFEVFKIDNFQKDSAPFSKPFIKLFPQSRIRTAGSSVRLTRRANSLNPLCQIFRLTNVYGLRLRCVLWR
jgi:hypothetical protein